jgi:leucyl-tRNA synthetase
MALLSALLQVPVLPKIALSGEITLTGQVLPVGGLKEKMLAALREGVQTVVLPRTVAPEVHELPVELKRGLDIVYVDTFLDVLPHVLQGLEVGGREKPRPRSTRDPHGAVVTGVSMSARYAPHEVEERLMQGWLARSAFHASAADPRPAYTISIPPPNFTGSLHMGHALNDTIQDILIRYNHLRGYNTLWVVGTDHAGIATQNKVEGQLAGEGLSKEDIGREAFEKRVWEWRREYGSTIIHQLKRLGCACDYESERFTMDDAYREAVAKVFVSLYEKGDIYRDVYLVNWCVRCGSAISDLEVEHEDRASKLYYVSYPVADSNESLTVATTRPETILGDTAVAVNPKDPRYGRFVGKMAIVPLTGREVPIIADEHVDIGFGTGALKITPGHDPDDWEIGRRHGLPSLTVIGLDGIMTVDAGEFAGLPTDQARRPSQPAEQMRTVRQGGDYNHAWARATDAAHIGRSPCSGSMDMKIGGAGDRRRGRGSALFPGAGSEVSPTG